MNARGKVYIVPNDTTQKKDVFYREIMQDHLVGMNDFCVSYQLPYQFEAGAYQMAPCFLASQGHLVVKTEESLKIAVCYIPKSITDSQDYWIHNMYEELKKYVSVGAYLIDQEDDIKNLRHKNGLDEIIKVCDRRNLFYKKKEDEENVRKKI